MNPPTDREFGRLEGKVDEMSHRVERVEQAVVAAAAASSAEHAEVGRKLEQMGKDFNNEIASLRTMRDEGRGVARVIQAAKGAALLLLAALPFLISKGGP